MEQGIEDSRGVLVVNSVYDSENNSFTLNKTWQEIYDAFPFVIEYRNESGKIGKACFHEIYSYTGSYGVEGFDSYITSSASGYPTTAGDDTLVE